MRFSRGQSIGEVPGWDLDLYAKAEHKVARLAVPVLLDFADVAGSGMARGFMDVRMHPETAQDSLREIQHGLMTLWAIAEDLIQRDQDTARLAPRK